MGKLFGHKQFNFDFIGTKKIWYIIALLAIIPGLIVMAFFGMNLGLDFTGGSILEISYTQPTDLAAVREIVSGQVGQNPSINESENNHFIIRSEELSDEQSAALTSALSDLGEMEVVRSQLIGPTIGLELLHNARLAILIAGLLMLVYITLRFKFNYAITAIGALAHDVLVMLSMVTIFRIEVNSAFIAAALTVVGYSINNTIVVYDRIRENTSLMGRVSFAELINASINQTLTRSINTTVAVLLLLLTLCLFGGDTTKNFLITLIIGVTAGFYSSAFLSGNMLNDVSSVMSKYTGFRKQRKASVAKKNPLPSKSR